jgi:hypothetical protein
MGGSVDFDLAAVYRALDEAREAKGLSWQALTDRINAQFAGVGVAHPINASTVKGLRVRSVVEGDGVLQVLLWLRRSPESFVPGHPLAGAPEAMLPVVGPDRILRWDPPALHRAVDARRAERNLTWAQAAGEVGCGTATMTGLARAQRVTLPGVMRIVGWVVRPAADFTRASAW